MVWIMHWMDWLRLAAHSFLLAIFRWINWRAHFQQPREQWSNTWNSTRLMNLGRINQCIKRIKKIHKYLCMTRLSDLSLHMPRQGQKHLVVHPLHLFQWNTGPFFGGLNSSSTLRLYVGFIENRLPKALEWSQIILCNLWLWGCNCNLQIFLCV